MTAKDNHGTIRYFLTGTDADQFEVDTKTGQIKTIEDLNYESDTTDTTNQCDTANRCEVTITARDSTGEASAPAATVAITITDVNEKPRFSTGAQTINVPENSTALWHATTAGYSVRTVDGATGVTYTAADPEGLTVTYSLVGPDASKFKLTGSTPVLSFVNKADFEAKASADGDNEYEVTVRATVGSDIGDRKVRVNVGNVDEAPVIALVPATGLRISGDARVSVREGTTEVATYSVLGENAASARWSVTGGADRNSFTIGRSTGVLTFRTAPDYESPGSADGDNVYSVTLTATAGANSDTHDVTVTVTDVDDTGTGSGTLLQRYDADGNNDISDSELQTAILDWSGGTLTDNEMLSLILLWS